MLTLVTKQDLWWDERQQVRQYYEHSEYNKYIEEIRASLGERRFVHEYLSTALEVSNFRSGDGHVLANVVAGYEDGIRLANMSHMVNALIALA
jgi:hypothetical protein